MSTKKAIRQAITIITVSSDTKGSPGEREGRGRERGEGGRGEREGEREGGRERERGGEDFPEYTTNRDQCLHTTTLRDNNRIS